MVMTEQDIILDYNQAKNQAAQIEVIADLNGCKPAEIKEILKKNGLIENMDKADNTQPAQVSDWHETAIELYKSGRSASEISKKLGQTYKAVHSYLSRKGVIKPAVINKAFDEVFTEPDKDHPVVTSHPSNTKGALVRCRKILDTIDESDSETIARAYSALIALVMNCKV